MRAPAAITPNARVRGAAGFVGTVADTLLFSNPVSVTGQWTVPDTRTFVGGVPTVSTSSAGIALHPVTGTTGPINLVQPDTRLRSG